MCRKASYRRSASVAAISTLPVIVGCALFGTTGARAAPFEVNINEASGMGTCVFTANCLVATASGNINLTGLTPGTTAGASSGIQPSLSGIFFSTTVGSLTVQRFTGGITFTSGPQQQFGTNTSSFFPSTQTPQPAPIPVGISGNVATPTVFVSPNYVSDSPIPLVTSIYTQLAAQTFAGLGLTPGSYEWTWGQGLPDQSFTVNIGPVETPSEIPLPAALPLFGTGLGAFGLLGWRRKRRAQAVA